ncbi:hypothetical protein GC176_14855 [bacterium]|nr:hypothetical protein [bacterium]
MPRFVLLEHDHPFLHWDLMLEWGDALRTWRLDQVPRNAASIPVERLPDHRSAYLDYEGPVSGNRGTVRRIDTGEFTLLESCAGSSDSEGSIAFRLTGGTLRGTARIVSDASNAARATLMWQPASAEESEDRASGHV